jgi:hypothetical protein
MHYQFDNLNMTLVQVVAVVATAVPVVDATVNDIGRCFLLFMFLIIFFHYHLPPADSTC